MNKAELIELGVYIEEAETAVKDAFVLLKRFGKNDDAAVASLVLNNVKTMKSRYMSWASEQYGLGLNDDILKAVERIKHREPGVSIAQSIESAVTSIGSGRP